MGIFVRYFLWRGGGGDIVFLAYDNVWHLANGAGIPAPSDAIDVSGMGIPTPPQGQRPEDLGHRADEQKPLFA